MIYMQLYEAIRSAIERGDFKPGSRIPHTKELVSRYHVSQTTVAHAVKLLEKEGLVRRIKSKGTFVLEEGKSALIAYKKSNRIAILFDGYLSDYMNSHFMTQAYKGMETVSRSEHKELVMIPREKKELQEYLYTIRTSGASGAILHSPYCSVMQSLLPHLTIPYVCIDFIDHGLQVDQITIDHLRAGALALRTLQGLGHDSILFFGNYLNAERSPSRHHEYWYHSMTIEGQFLKCKKVQAAYLPIEEQGRLKERMLTTLQAHRDCTGYVCASYTFFKTLKEILETHPSFQHRTHDVVLFADIKEELMVCGRKVYQCRWSTQEMGTQAISTLLNKLRGGPHRPQTYYLPVQIR